MSKRIEPGRWALCESIAINGTVGLYPWHIDKVSGSRAYLSRVIIDPVDKKEEAQTKYVSASTIHSTYDSHDAASKVGAFDWRVHEKVRELLNEHAAQLNTLIAEVGGVQ